MSIELDEDKEIMQEINEGSIASFLNCAVNEMLRFQKQ